MRARWKLLSSSRSSDSSNSDNSLNDSKSSSSDEDGHGDDEVNIIGRPRSDISGIAQGLADIFVIEDRREAVANYTHYKYRGPSLAHMSFYEY